MSDLLKKGDHIRLTKGMKISGKIPNKFRYSSTNRIFLDSSSSYPVFTIGEVLNSHTISKDELIKVLYERLGDAIIGISFSQCESSIISLIDSLQINFEPETFDTSIFIGEYVVYDCKWDGGEEDLSADRSYEDGWHVFCKKVENPEICVDFYQTGCFINVINIISPL